jgi:hypothetical protein
MCLAPSVNLIDQGNMPPQHKRSLQGKLKKRQKDLQQQLKDVEKALAILGRKRRKAR